MINLENREQKIDRLIEGLQFIQQSLTSAKNDETLSFSFFRETFERMQHIMHQLHDLEISQVEEMKQQMEKLLTFLSEQNKQQTPPQGINPEEKNGEEPTPVLDKNQETVPDEISTQEEPKSAFAYPKHVILPEFKDPRQTQKEDETQSDIASSISKKEKSSVQSFNDTMQAPPSLADKMHGLSLNDRFLFQRELFSNNREAMNSMMLRLEAFDSYEGVESYIKENTSWNINDETVKLFLQALKKRFE